MKTTQNQTLSIFCDSVISGFRPGLSARGEATLVRDLAKIGLRRPIPPYEIPKHNPAKGGANAPPADKRKFEAVRASVARQAPPERMGRLRAKRQSDGSERDTEKESVANLTPKA